MDLPHIGVSLPIFGPHAGPDAVRTVAMAAERAGFHSVAVSERLLLPADPGWVNENGIPEWPVYDALEMLAWAGAHTERIRLSTAIVNPLFQPPIVLARRLATIDQLSKGRLDVGLGQGWLDGEFVATGITKAHQGAGFEEHIAAMRACWGADPVTHEGTRYAIPRSRIGPKPVQDPLPLFIGAGSRVSIERAARLGAGFIGALWDWAVTDRELGWYRDAGGRGPIVVSVVHDWVLAEGSDPFDPNVPIEIDAGVVGFLERCAGAGATEVRWEPNLIGAGLSPERQVQAFDALAAVVAP